MLYEEGTLTEEQAEQVIGEKMMARINSLNSWCKENGFRLCLHSTFKGVEKDIFKDGLNFPVQSTFDSKEEILQDANISEKDLESLENWVKNHNGHAGKLSRIYETYPPVETATVTGYTQLTAKDLLEYNHRGGDITVILCVPIKRIQSIGTGSSDEFRVGFSRHIDPYLRRTISCKQNQRGEFNYKSEYLYPPQSVLCAFDRDNIKIKFNQEYDETFYLDSSTPQNGNLKKGDLFTQLREVEQKFLSGNAQGRSR